MPLPVADRSSNKNEQIDHAAEIIGRSRYRAAVFRAVYTGKRRIKTVPGLCSATGFPRNRVLDAGKLLSDQGLVETVKVGGITGYRKIDFFQAHRNKVLFNARNPAARKALPTKRRPVVSNNQRMTLEVRLPRARMQAARITIDDIDSFRRVRSHRGSFPYQKIPEARFKKGVAKILGERGTFKDWGGENRDLSSSRICIRNERCQVAIAFKGPGVSGVLTPGKMGKNGDQIQRLFRCPADMFVVQYWGQIDDSVVEQMETSARLKAYYENRRVTYCVIDGSDSSRLIAAYPKEFGKH